MSDVTCSPHNSEVCEIVLVITSRLAKTGSRSTIAQNSDNFPTSDNSINNSNTIHGSHSKTLKSSEQIANENRDFPVEFTDSGEIEYRTNPWYYTKELARETAGVNASDLKNIVFGDGNNNLEVILINGEYPGPTIRVPENAFVAITVNNQLSERGTIIHWHGLSQKGSFSYDGTEYLQCPIPPRKKFIYRFRASPAGVHWYHAHYQQQRYDGLFGAFIVERETEVEKPIPVILHEIGHLTSGANTGANDFQSGFSGAVSSHSFNRPRSHEGFDLNSGYFDNRGINGRGRNRQFLEAGSKIPFEIIKYRQNKQLAFINAGGDFGVEISVEKHFLRILESDGISVEPVEVTFLHIHPGETFKAELVPIDEHVLHNSETFFLRSDTLGEYNWNEKNMTVEPMSDEEKVLGVFF